MNLWQVTRQLQYLGRLLKWPGGTDPTFDTQSVKIVEPGQEEALIDESLIPPLFIISPGPGVTDPAGGGEEPGLVEEGIVITLATVNQGDRTGEQALVGGQRTGPLVSPGRGLLELEAVVFGRRGPTASSAGLLGLVTSTLGVVIAMGPSGSGAVRKVGENWVAVKDYNLKAYCTREKFFHPVRNLKAATSTGLVSLTWKNPATRWDTYKLLLTRKAGSSAPAAPSDGTAIAITGFPTVKTDTPAAGTYSYALWVAYSEYDTTTQVVDSLSAPATALGVVAF